MKLWELRDVPDIKDNPSPLQPCNHSCTRTTHKRMTEQDRGKYATIKNAVRTSLGGRGLALGLLSLPCRRGKVEVSAYGSSCRDLDGASPIDRGHTGNIGDSVRV
jgi:hypothetical protein